MFMFLIVQNKPAKYSMHKSHCTYAYGMILRIIQQTAHLCKHDLILFPNSYPNQQHVGKTKSPQLTLFINYQQ